MKNVLDLIISKKLFTPGSIVGVGVSGGSDSMALLHFLAHNKELLDIEVVAVNVHHGTRANDEVEAQFVADYCKEQGIRFLRFDLGVGVLAKQKGKSMEEACRDGRYAVFESLRKRGLIDYIALAHHQRDQAETILLHILRGSGLTGASGMDFVRDNYYVRPFLDTPKEKIMQYVYENNIDYLEDETNTDTTISRNLLRQEIMPKLRAVWPNLDENLCSFGKICKEDNAEIKKLMNFNALEESKNLIKIPLTYFVYGNALIIRLLNNCFQKLNVLKNIERKHYEMVIDLAKSGANGSRLNLPENLIVYKEYEYITITKSDEALKQSIDEVPFKIGSSSFGDFGKIKVKKVKSSELGEDYLLVDLDKIPEGAVWRIRQEGDYIQKFGGGMRKLKAYLVDKKIPVRLRNILPVLAQGSEILVVGGVDISENLKLTDDTKNIGQIKFELQNWA